jgi:hypothetical protein
VVAEALLLMTMWMMAMTDNHNGNGHKQYIHPPQDKMSTVTQEADSGTTVSDGHDG